jgi:Phage integrase, N-terminal SAM-like domain
MTPPLASALGTGKPKLLDQVRQLLRLRHYSLCAEEAYLAWMKRFILSHGKRHPRELNERETESPTRRLTPRPKTQPTTPESRLKILPITPTQILDGLPQMYG